jgi:hypothetical protein
MSLSDVLRSPGGRAALKKAIDTGFREGLRRSGFYDASRLMLRALIAHGLAEHQRKQAAAGTSRGPRGPGEAGSMLTRQLAAAEAHRGRVEVSGYYGAIRFNSGSELADFRRKYRGRWQEDQYFSPEVRPVVKCM